MRADLELAGAPADYIERACAVEEPVEIEVMHECRHAVEVFLACQTQWRVGGMGGLLGLDYSAVDTVMRILRTPDRPETFAGVRVIERAVLAAMSEKAERERHARRNF
ncbi:MAG: DUF1799 domain-containing protein [Sinobacteraceae bacterium]|nr:DUF1799 domain-containing protein [Nevskiaceae bacterium]